MSDNLPIPSLIEEEDDALALIRNWSRSKRLIIMQQLYRLEDTKIDDCDREISRARKKEAAEKMKG